MRIGIIYRFTILSSYFKRDGFKVFYIGQHWENRSIEHYIYSPNYYGSGNIWLNYLSGLRKKYKNTWKKFIVREILFYSDKVTQRGLDAMEAYYIKKYKSHYSYKQGGCNVLWGTANKFGNNPMYDKTVIEKVKKKKEGKYKGDKSYWFGRHLSEETKQKLREKAHQRYREGRHPSLGLKISDERKRLLSKIHKGKFWITDGINEMTLPAGSVIPEGWRRGKKSMSKETKEKLRQAALRQGENKKKTAFN